MRKKMKLNKMTFRGDKVWITDLRIKPSDRINDLYYYDIRDNSEGEPCSIEDFVMVNHWGTIVSTKNLDHLLTQSWGNGRRRIDLIEDEVSNIYTALSERSSIEHEDILKEKRNV